MFESGTDGGDGIAVLASAARRAAEVRVAAVGDGELMGLVADLEAVRRAVEAAMAHVAGELDVRGVVESRAGLGTAGWVAH